MTPRFHSYLCTTKSVLIFHNDESHTYHEPHFPKWRYTIDFHELAQFFKFTSTLVIVTPEFVTDKPCNLICLTHIDSFFSREWWNRQFSFIQESKLTGSAILNTWFSGSLRHRGPASRWHKKEKKGLYRRLMGQL